MGLGVAIGDDAEEPESDEEEDMEPQRPTAHSAAPSAAAAVSLTAGIRGEDALGGSVDIDEALEALDLADAEQDGAAAAETVSKLRR